MAHLNSPRESAAAARSPSLARVSGRWRDAWLARTHALRDRLPLACLLCDARVPGGLCEHCRHAVQVSMTAGARCPRCDLALVQAPCPDCPELSPALTRVFAAFDYQWPGDLLIQRLKLQGRFSCAPVLAALMAARLETRFFPRDTVVTAVPASRASLLLRGYNPAAEIGRAFARRLRLEWRPGLVHRAKGGNQQKGLSRGDRRDEVQGLYQSSAKSAGKRVLVVDDVMTTGSTLEAIALALKEQGAHEVWGAVAARTGLNAHREQNSAPLDCGMQAGSSLGSR